MNDPVVEISWEEAMSACTRVTHWLASALPEGYSFCLPTEAQWEYACRAGTTTRYYNGDHMTDLDLIAWHRQNSGGKPHAVGEKQSNAWGLYDMIGNVMELCFDELSTYPKGGAIDWVGTSAARPTPHRPLMAAQHHIIRGSNFLTPRESTLNWCSASGDPGVMQRNRASSGVGFRLCLRA